MTPEKLQERIQSNQTWLLDISIKIKDSINIKGKKNNIYNWIIDILHAKKEILAAFDLQNEQKICKAILTLLNPNSSYRDSLLKMITYRVLAYTNSAVYLKNYVKDNVSIEQIAQNLQPLLDLVDNYTIEFLESLTIENVYVCLTNNGLKDFIIHFRETDVQIVLKAIKGDERREMKKAKLQILLGFLFVKLQANALKHRSISTSRHAWWSFKDTLSYRETHWLIENRSELKVILNSLLSYGIYFDKKHAELMTNDILETTSIYYERVWVLENAIQVLKRAEDLAEVFTSDDVRELRHFIQTEIDLHEKSYSRENNLRNVQCDLICLYFILSNYNLVYLNIQKEDLQSKEDTKSVSKLTAADIIKAVNR